MSEEHGEPGHEEHDIGCLQALEVFYAWLDGELEDPRSVADFERHMEHCRSCWSRAELETLLNERLRSMAPARAPESLRRRMRDLLDHL